MTETTQGGPLEAASKTGGCTSENKEGDLRGIPHIKVGETGYPPGSPQEDRVRREHLARWEMDD